jgi:hypothetical protein
MEIITFGGGGRLEFCREYLSALSPRRPILILPIPTSKDNLHIKGTDVPLSDIYPLLKEGVTVAAYGLSPQVRKEMETLGATVFDGAEEEEFLGENARLTAEGALGIILTDSDSSLAEMKVGLIGYGRIGSRLLRLLLLLGARVRLYTRNKTLRQTLGSQGIETSDFSETSDYSDLDLLINTAPVRVMGKEELSGYEQGGLKIYDLASGVCFPESPSVKKLSSIPETLYPKSAGRLYAEFILRRLSEVEE